MNVDHNWFWYNQRENTNKISKIPVMNIDIDLFFFGVYKRVLNS